MIVLFMLDGTGRSKTGITDHPQSQVRGGSNEDLVKEFAGGAMAEVGTV
jgi:hypothetical protein